MQSVLSEMRRCLRPGAPMHMMVSDAALYGVHVPSPQWLRVMMVEMGFNSVSCEMVRPRGHRWVLDKREGSKRGLVSNCISWWSKFRSSRVSFKAWKAWKACGQSLSALSVEPRVRAWIDHEPFHTFRASTGPARPRRGAASNQCDRN